MKFSSLSSILFVVLVSASACGDKSKPVEHKPAPVFVDDAPKKLDEKPSPVAQAEVPKQEPVKLPGKFGECVSLGKEYAAKGEHEKARELFEAALGLDKKHSAPYIELARSFISTNDKALALKHANKGVKLAPESSYAYNTLGRAELLRHDYDKAIEAFSKATELDDTNAWAWNNLGLVYLTLEQYEDAVAALTEATAQKGATGFMFNNLGVAHEQLDQLDEARVAFESGGKLGSAEASASRKRLQGVKSIIVMKTKKPEPKVEKTPEVQMEPEAVSDDVDEDSDSI
jgi:tetratricopeptide (TPR) repeat protein